MRGTIGALFALATLSTACIAVLGVEDVPVPDTTSDGGAGAGADSAVPSELTQALHAFSVAFCRRRSSCYPEFFARASRDIDECSQGIDEILSAAAALPGFAGTASDFQACAASVPASTCDAVYGQNLEVVCPVKGTKQIGERCSFSYQCASDACDTDPAACRACVELPSANQPCTAAGLCGAGLACSNNHTCVTPSTGGSACSDATVCQLGLSCSGGFCTVLPAAANAPCDPTVGCNMVKGFTCQLTNRATYICVPYTVAQPGDSCGPDLTTYVTCLRALCDEDDVTCPPLPKEGDPCNETVACPPNQTCLGGICAGPLPPSGCQ